MVGHLSLSSQPPEFYALLIGQPQLVEIGPGSTPSSKGMHKRMILQKWC
jgi:hypothetical protein